MAIHVEKCYSSGNWEGKSRELIEQKRELYFKLAKDFLKGNLYTIPIIGQLSQLMEHKIMVGFDSVPILGLDLFCSLDIFALYSNYQKFELFI